MSEIAKLERDRNCSIEGVSLAAQFANVPLVVEAASQVPSRESFVGSGRLMMFYLMAQPNEKS